MDRTSLTPASSPMSSSVIDMRELSSAHREMGARTSVPTLDLVLSVASPMAPLAAPMAVEIRRPAPRARWSAAQLLSAIAVAAFVAWSATSAMSRAPSRHAATDVAVPPHTVASAETKSPAGLHASTTQTAPASGTASAASTTTPRRRRGPAVVRPTAPTAEPAPASATTSTTDGASSIDELMRRVSASNETSATSFRPDARPASPDRDAVRAAMRSVAPAVAACVPGNGGTVPVTLIVEGATGRVRSATVGGELAGTASGACIAEAAAQAHLAPFSRATFTVQYPFAL